MKWRSRYGKQLDETNKLIALIGVEQKLFAWWPEQMDNGDTVWLCTYYKIVKSYDAPWTGTTFVEKWVK